MMPDIEIERSEWHYISSPGMSLHFWVNSEGAITDVAVHDLDTKSRNVVQVNTDTFPIIKSHQASIGDGGYSLKDRHKGYNPDDEQFVKTFITSGLTTEAAEREARINEAASLIERGAFD